MISNGNFKSYVIASNTYELVEATTTKTAYALFPNWYVKKGNASKSWAILSNGNSSYGTELVAGNQCAVFQQANTGGISFLELSQTINLQPGVYDITFDNNYRKPLNTYYATTHKMYIEVSNASETALIKTEVPIGSTWQTRTYRFNVTTQNNFELIFTSYDSNSTLYSSIFLANVALTLVSTPVSTSSVYPCFKEGSKILRLDPETDVESYVHVESLRCGDLIKTSQNGHKAIFHIGKRTLPRPSDDPDPRNRLYRLPKSISKEMIADLYITGEHCILHKSISDELKERVRKHMGDVYITEYQYRVPACIDDRSEPYQKDDPVTIWHFALENHSIYRNYGVYANGLLVESCSIQYLTEMSNMELGD
jgi:hypothetical protein